MAESKREARSFVTPSNKSFTVLGIRIVTLNSPGIVPIGLV
jgi:hypothetical protein